MDKSRPEENEPPVDEVSPEIKAALAALPELDSPAFWRKVEPFHPEAELVPLEVLARAVRSFARRNQPDKASQVFEIIYMRYEKIALKQAAQNPYLNFYSPNRRADMAEELAMEAWLKVWQKLASGNTTFYEVNFSYKFIQELKTAGRDLARKNGLIGSTRPEEGKAASTRRIPAGKMSSLEAPLTVDGEEPYTLADLTLDPNAQFPFEFVDALDTLKSTLTSEEVTILLLQADGCSKSEIARILHLDWETVSRRLKKIEARLKEAGEQKTEPWAKEGKTHARK